MNFVLPHRVSVLGQTENKRFVATLNDETSVNVDCVVIATDVQYRKVPCEGLEGFEGAGVYNAATDTHCLSDMLKLISKGFIETGEGVGRRSQYETHCNGVFADGAVRAGSVKRVATSVSEGSVVISSTWKHIRNIA